MNLIFEFEPDSNIYTLDHFPVDLRDYCLETNYLLFIYKKKKKDGEGSMVKLTWDTLD